MQRQSDLKSQNFFENFKTIYFTLCLRPNFLFKVFWVFWSILFNQIIAQCAALAFDPKAPKYKE